LAGKGKTIFRKISFAEIIAEKATQRPKTKYTVGTSTLPYLKHLYATKKKDLIKELFREPVPGSLDKKD
jgi:hypothetical protein